MIYSDLLLNLTLLVALTIASGFIEKRWSRHRRQGVMLQGILFGGAAVAGMLQPAHLGPGLIFDGRSIMVSLCALFFGPLAGIPAALMTMTCRAWLGGTGMITGLLVIMASAGIGLAFRYRLDPEARPPSAKGLYLFGLAVHLAMITLMTTLPQGAGPAVIKRIGLPVLLLFPLATVLAGKILSDQVLAAHTIADLQKAKRNLAITLKSIGDAVISTNLKGEIEFINPAAEALTGWSRLRACGQPFEEILRIVDIETREKVENPVQRVLEKDEVLPLANHTLLIAEGGAERVIAHSAAPIHDARGNLSGAVLVLHDQTDQLQVQRLMQARLDLLEYAAGNSLEDILTKALDEAGALSGSPVGFCHFVGTDQQTVYLQQWSSRTRLEFCRASGKGMHYSVDRAGVWADCIRQQKPVVHNDYASLPHRKGQPEGHVRVMRELVVPIIREGRVVAVLGVGNKPADYTERDVEVVSHLADMVWQIAEKKRTEEVLKESERRYRDLFENAPIGIFRTTSGGKALSVNAAMARMLGFGSPQDAVKYYTSLQTQLYADPVQRKQFLQILRAQGHVENFEYRARRADGETILLSMNARIADEAGDGTFVIEGFTTDITAQRRLEEQFRQAQKMESVGRLAGGVAHDYNNMLGVILGYAELALEKVNPSEPIHDDLKEILQAARRSATITRQLLAFARKQAISPRALDLNETVQGMLKMLRRLIGENIHLEWLPGSDLWQVKMDPSQIDQILANLCINARDAIAGGGRIAIRTENARLDERDCAGSPDMVPGEFVLLSVSDDGCGMDKDILANIFEPFFTTKEAHQGTGLGLPTVYGIVKQNNGFIRVVSKPGQGGTFQIFLPRHEGPPVENRLTPPTPASSGMGEAVLLVEDEPAIMEIGRIMLTKLGYRVITANRPEEALQKAEAHPDGIELLLTDVVMPGMNGRELSERLQSLNPSLKCLFMSGYTSDVILHHGILDNGVNFIQKPFSIQDLAAKVRQTLDRP